MNGSCRLVLLLLCVSAQFLYSEPVPTRLVCHSSKPVLCAATLPRRIENVLARELFRAFFLFWANKKYRAVSRVKFSSLDYSVRLRKRCLSGGWLRRTCPTTVEQCALLCCCTLPVVARVRNLTGGNGSSKVTPTTSMPRKALSSIIGGKTVSQIPYL